jgi:flagellum-specific ATP synthase
MNDIVAPDHARIARKFRALVATYEANRDLVLMGAYRQGADPQLDRAIAMHERLTAFSPSREEIAACRQHCPARGADRP